ncbi:uncharacterized protein TRAVEDRAFT_25986 [Trametes versicolor FP-101664 SS1]|uniref:uncharacterized protein n=1 Tax=Trametes versicolor (strain FP-101664) TaxID=717944 RepID=UPI00046228A2|nr:uncharacterized protein TRAVEDRAFT_25986 [Trametes versicolor FP-101664 SS1]EIW65032.1 hypothetical protein TRAVEDRAFT_25986 [Trametes versicolor FP-101664 SS1]
MANHRRIVQKLNQPAAHRKPASSADRRPAALASSKWGQAAVDTDADDVGSPARGGPGPTARA